MHVIPNADAIRPDKLAMHLVALCLGAVSVLPIIALATGPSPASGISKGRQAPAVTPDSSKAVPADRFTVRLPDGQSTIFVLVDSGTLPPELARRYPGMRSLKGNDAAGRHIRLDLSESR